MNTEFSTYLQGTGKSSKTVAGYCRDVEQYCVWCQETFGERYCHVDRRVLGRQMVFFIRRASQPEKPFFTTEIDIDAGRIQQLNGFSDCSALKEVRGFVEDFVRAAMRWRGAERRQVNVSRREKEKVHIVTPR